MKKLLSIALLYSLFPLPFSLSAMPLKWVCNFPDTKAEVFRVYQGETVTFEPTFRVNGKTVDLDIEGVYIQTNGMAGSWWKLDGNTFTPTNDVGAAAYRFFIGAAGEGGKNYRANGTLRMLPSPGFEPNTLALPIHTLDFSQVEVKNAPWPDGTKVDQREEKILAKISSLEEVVDTKLDISGGQMTGELALDYYGLYFGPFGGTEVYATVGNAADEVSFMSGEGKMLMLKTKDGGTVARLQDFVLPFDGEKQYGVGDLVVYEHYLYRCKNPHKGWFLERNFELVQNENLLGDAAKDAAEAKEAADSLAALVYGDDCQLIATNYNSATKIPSLMVRFKLKDEATGTNLWYTVYDELRWWNWLTTDHLPANYFSKVETAALLDEKADRAWGFFDSHSGGYAPDGYTWISSPKIAIAAGMAYQRILTTSGAVWVLESNGLVTEVGGESETGFFRISDDKGKALFEITKGDEQIAPANAGGCTTRTEMGITHLNIPYFVESSEHPKIQVSRDLKTWFDEGDNACPANVAWSGQSGAYTADVWGKQAEPKLFVQATYKKGAEDKIVNTAPVEFTKLVIGGITYTVAAEEINGKKVLVLK